MNLIDIGANLAHASFSDDLDAVLARGAAQGVKQLIVTGTDLDTVERSIALAEQYAGQLYATAGVHPHEADTFTDTTATAIKAFAAPNLVVAIGECGLDFNRNYSSPEAQERAFDAQLALAAELGLPVFIHERDAHERLYDMLKAWRSKLVDAVVHCFTGEEHALRRYLELDLHIGITGWICDERRGHHLQDLVSLIPLERLMLETDAPYLLPRDYPHKKQLQSSRRNEPCTLRHTAETVARCMNVPYEELAEQTTQTAQRFFRLSE